MKLIPGITVGTVLGGPKFFFETDDLSTVEKQFGRETIYAVGDVASSFQQNVSKQYTNIRLAPITALKAAGFVDRNGEPYQITMKEIEAFPREKAHGVLLDLARSRPDRFGALAREGLEEQFLRGEKISFVGLPKLYLEYKSTIEAMLGENAKLAKGAHIEDNLKHDPAYYTGEIIDKIKNSYSRGLALLPHREIVEDRPGTSPLYSTRSRYWKTIAGLEPGSPFRFKTMCAFSTDECRKLCLSHSGNYELSEVQFRKRVVFTEFLLLHPVAFLRLLVDAIQLHKEKAEKKGKFFSVRLNVLSDIPWEVLCPELFTHFHDVHFYDYTKVPNRPKVGNYDLTFSFSGAPDNIKHAEVELKRGNKVSVVFWFELPCNRIKSGQCNRPSDLTFMGRRVVNGDLHDLRVLDPPGSVVGLSFKLVGGQQGGKRAYAEEAPEGIKFLVNTFRDPETGAIIVPNTPMTTSPAK